MTRSFWTDLSRTPTINPCNEPSRKPQKPLRRREWAEPLLIKAKPRAKASILLSDRLRVTSLFRRVYSSSSSSSSSSEKDMEYVLDVQGFVRSSNIFVLKEAALVEVSANTIPTALYFKPPCKWGQLLQEEQKKNLWLQDFHHGIPWNSGTIQYRDVIKVLQMAFYNASKIYVKGIEKKKWIEDIVPGKKVVNLEDLRCPSLKKMKKETLPCYYHTLTRDPACAVRNALILKNWLLNVRPQWQFLRAQEAEDVVNVNEGRVSLPPPPPLTHVHDAKFEKEILSSMYL